MTSRPSPPVPGSDTRQGQETDAEPSWPDGLEGLRDEIDAVDRAIHDLLMRRTELVHRIGAVKAAAAGGAPAQLLRPAREAIVLRRLVARHRGAFPVPELVRIWREMMSAALRLQGPFSVATADHRACRALTRDHFGSQVAP